MSASLFMLRQRLTKARALLKAKFDESKHRRDPHGKFSSGGGSKYAPKPSENAHKYGTDSLKKHPHVWEVVDHYYMNDMGHLPTNWDLPKGTDWGRLNAFLAKLTPQERQALAAGDEEQQEKLLRGSEGKHAEKALLKLYDRVVRDLEGAEHPQN